MKRQTWISHWLGGSLLAAAFGLAASVGVARATTIFSLSDTSVQTNGTFSITVGDDTLQPSDFTLASLSPIFSIYLDVGFDSNKLAVNSVTPGSLIPTSSPSYSSGLLSIPLNDPTNPNGSPSSLFTIVFGVNGTASLGDTTISFANDSIADSDPFAYQLIPFSAHVQITSPLSTTPLPGTGVLFLTGIAAFALLGRRAMRHSPSEVSV
jgi:hypothetical protein